MTHILMVVLTYLKRKGFEIEYKGSIFTGGLTDFPHQHEIGFAKRKTID